MAKPGSWGPLHLCCPGFPLFAGMTRPNCGSASLSVGLGRMSLSGCTGPAKGRRAAGDPNLKLEAPYGTDSSQTPRWREPDSNLRYRGRRRACGRSLRAQRVETDPAKGSSDQTVACLRRFAAGVVGSAAACAFRFRPPGDGQQESRLAPIGRHLVRLLRGGVLRTGCFPRQAAFQGGHEIDDGWRGRDLPSFNGEPLHLGFEQFSQGLLVTISIRRRIETSGPLRDDRRQGRYWRLARFLQ